MKQLTAKRSFSKFGFFVLSLFLGPLLHAQLTADFTMNKTGGCSPLSISFTSTSFGTTGNTSYAWDFGNGNTSVLQNPSAIYIEEKTYTVTLTIKQGAQSATKTKTISVYKKPSVDFTTPKPKVCLPDGVQFNANASAGDGVITSYQWDFGDGTVGNGFGNTFHYYNYQITPAVSLTVTNSYGCQSSVTKMNIVEVLSKIEPLFTANKAMICNLADSFKFTNNSTGPGVLQYLWNFGDGTTSTVKDPVHQYTQKGVYQVRLTVTNNVGCSVTSSPYSVNAAYFNTNFTAQHLCRQINFTGSSYLYPNVSVWSFGDATSATGFPNTSHTYATAGDYTVTLINTYNACKDTITKTVAVKSTGSFNSGITAPAAVCKNSSAALTSTSSVTPSSIAWNFGDGSTQNTTFANVNHVYTQPGTYTVRVTNTFGTCSETVTKTIVVNDLPSLTGFVADFGGVCGSPVTVTFRDTTPGAVAWQWWMDYNYFPSFSTAQNAPYHFTSNGFHTVYLTVTNAAGCSRSVSKPVTISSPSATIFHSYSSSPRGFYDCDSLTLKFGVNSNQPIQSYNWNFGNGITSTSPTPQVHYNTVGTYNVVLNYITETGCPGVATFSPRVYDKPQANFVYSIPCGNSLSLNLTNTAPFSDNEQWNWGDGSPAYYWNNPSHLYPDTGWYNVTLISHIGHCSDTITKPVYASLLPSSVSITKADNTCDGTRDMVTFDQRSLRCSGGTWDFGDGTTIPYDSSNHVVTHTYATTGTYQVRLTSSYKTCTYVSTRTVYVLRKQNPVLTANLTQMCADGSLNVQVTGLETNPFYGSYRWDQYYINSFQYSNATAFNGYISNYNFDYTTYAGTLQNFTAGTNAIRVILTEGSTGCKDTSNYINLQVNGPIAGFRMVNNNGCYKTPVTFVDTSRSSTVVALTSWRWEFGDGNFVINTSAAPVTHRYAGPGNYTVRLTVTDATGCRKIVTANATLRGPKAAFTTSGLFVPNVPLNTTVNFYNYTSSSGSVNYTWRYGDGTTSTNYSGQHTYTVPGTYTVMLIASEPSVPCADTATQVITVKDFNTAFSFTKSFLSASSCPPVLVRINNLSVGYTRLLWDFGDGTTSTQNYPSHTYYNPGLYRITLYTYGYNGLSGTYIDSIEIQRPSAQLSADALQGCVSKQISLQAVVQNATSFSWDFGDGSSATANAALPHNYVTAGIYTPRLIVKDSLGCPASAELSAPIVIDSLAIAIKGIPALVCDSALIQFTPDVESFAATRLGTTLRYKWDFGTGNAADTSNIKNASFRYVTPGTYTVTFTVTSPYGCSRQTTAVVVVQQKSNGAIQAVAESCEGSTVQFTGTATPSTGVQWDWDLGNGATSTSTTPPSQTYGPGNYTVRLILTKNGCKDTTIHPLTVHAKPVVNALPRQQVVCLGDSVLLSANGGGTYLWSPATGLNNNTLSSPKAMPRTSTLYKVRVTSGKGCVIDDSISITVAQPVNVSIAGATDLCKGLSNQLTASGAASYQWINNTAGLSNASIRNPFASPLFTSTYTVVGSDAHNCFKDTTAITIAVHNLPTVSAGPDVEIQGGAPYQLTATGSSDVTAWLWSPGDKLSCTACASPMATPKMETLYVVKVSNDRGCVAYDSVLVKLQCAMANVYIPDAFTPNGDGRNDVFYISGSGVKIIRYLRIYDRWGGLMFQKTSLGIDDRASAWDGRVNGQPVATGSYVYLAELECSSGEKFIRKGTVTLVR